ncbi:MAG: cysteine desulfurase family protein [Methylococcales bacterium]|nr:cysteine desulfurase family protein [Methylococcales bacterium]
MIYFDHNATTPLDEQVLAAMQPYLSTFYGNPSSLYRHGRIARSAIDTAREQVAALVDCQAAQIIFTSGGTEANNLALAGLALGDKLAISAIEHPSITAPALHLAKHGIQLQFLPVDSNGHILPKTIDALVQEKPHRVSIMLANNETGVIQDVGCFTQQLKHHNIAVHTDAVQAMGKIPLSFKQLGVDLMSLSSHKIYGPKGCGALVVGKNTAIAPMLLGGEQEQGLRGGTENVAAIVGFGKAAELAKAGLVERSTHLRALRALLEDGLTAIEGLTLFAQQAERLPNTVQFSLANSDGEMLLMKLDQKGIAVSSGSACASGGNQPSPVLTAMGFSDSVAKGAIRVSLGMGNTKAEILEFINQLKALVYQA